MASQPAAVLVWELFHSGGVAISQPTSCCHSIGAIPFKRGGQWPANQLLSLYGSHSMWPVAIQPAAVLVWEPVHSGGVASGHPTSCCHCMGAIPFRWGGQWPVNQLLSLYGSHSIQEGGQWPANKLLSLYGSHSIQGRWPVAMCKPAAILLGSDVGKNSCMFCRPISYCQK